MSRLISNVFDHFIAIEKLAATARARVTMHFPSYNLEVIANHRHYIFYSRFASTDSQGRRCYTDRPTLTTTGFIGWLPYRTLNFDLSDDKLLFKKYITDCGYFAPRKWSSNEAVNADFIVKLVSGSYGVGITGPFHSNEDVDAILSQVTPHGGANSTPFFFEEFIKGDILKIWCWGGKPFFAHKNSYPEITGDGINSIRQLLGIRLQFLGVTLETSPNRLMIEACVKYQGYSLDVVLPPNQSVWIDFRYGYLNLNYSVVMKNPASAALYNQRYSLDNALKSMGGGELDQINKAVRSCSEYLKTKFPFPILFALDACVDENGKVFWLEINSNPSLPPAGYFKIFESLFDVPAEDDVG